MEITYELLEEDYVAFQLNHIEHSPSQKRILLTIRYILPIVCALVIYFIGTSVFNQPAIYWSIIALLFTLGCWYYYPTLHENSIRKQTLNMLKEGDNSSVFGVKKVIIGDDSIQIIEGNESESSLSRQQLKEIKLYENQIVLYVSAVQGVIIPKRSMDVYTQNKFIEALYRFQESELSSIA